MDIQVVFIQSPIEDAVYVNMTRGQEETNSKTGAPMVMKLKHSLYG